MEVKNLWDKEYNGVTSIPSSLRQEPAHALVELFKDWQPNAGRVLDLGCGNGRNARYLASKGFEVVAMDYSDSAIKLVADNSQDFSVTPVQHDIKEGLPFEDCSFDYVLDAYCLCHFVEIPRYHEAIKEVARVLKPEGALIKLHIDNNDTYYVERKIQDTAYGHLSFNSENGIYKAHMSAEEYVNLLGENFKLFKCINVSFNDEVNGAIYKRSIFACVTRKVIK